MHVGIFLEEARPGSTPAGAFKDTFELVEAAEAWGLDGVWLGEIHFNVARSVLSSPLVMAAAIAGRTQRLRIGTAVHLLPLNHPLRIAEDVATLDHMSEGRFEFGVGRSGSPRAYDVLGVPYGESQARFAEALDIIREAWKGEGFKYDGKFFRVQTGPVAPTPYQRPHPPIRMAVNTPESFAIPGELGVGIFLGLRALDVADLKAYLPSYRGAWRPAGQGGAPTVYLRVPVYIAPSEREARAECEAALLSFCARQAEITRLGLGRAGTGSADRKEFWADRLAGLDYEAIVKTRAVVGTASHVAEQLGALRDELGLDGVVAELDPGCQLPVDRVMRTLRILTHEVMPALA
ncbi:MAG: LLM class flavin-dependent oxidoreductase [Candidatus Rokuibacteriota bacterium]|nr:MAG: LLM class flavin-dependent oxidoreductase [Candidatus Rokubacteria bacterium]